MNESQAIRQNDNARLLEQIRADTLKIKQFYNDYPYCKVCKCRAPRGHETHLFEPIIFR